MVVPYEEQGDTRDNRDVGNSGHLISGWMRRWCDSFRQQSGRPSDRGQHLSANDVSAGGIQYPIHGDGSERSDEKGSHLGGRAHPWLQLHGNGMRDH